MLTSVEVTRDVTLTKTARAIMMMRARIPQTTGMDRGTWAKQETNSTSDSVVNHPVEQKMILSRYACSNRRKYHSDNQASGPRSAKQLRVNVMVNLALKIISTGQHVEVIVKKRMSTSSWKRCYWSCSASWSQRCYSSVDAG